MTLTAAAWRQAPQHRGAFSASVRTRNEWRHPDERRPTDGFYDGTGFFGADLRFAAAAKCIYASWRIGVSMG